VNFIQLALICHALARFIYLLLVYILADWNINIYALITVQKRTSSLFTQKIQRSEILFPLSTETDCCRRFSIWAMYSVCKTCNWSKTQTADAAG
jgi:hypothetical protein